VLILRCKQNPDTGSACFGAQNKNRFRVSLHMSGNQYPGIGSTCFGADNISRLRVSFTTQKLHTKSRCLVTASPFRRCKRNLWIRCSGNLHRRCIQIPILGSLAAILVWNHCFNGWSQSTALTIFLSGNMGKRQHCFVGNTKLSDTRSFLMCWSILNLGDHRLDQLPYSCLVYIRGSFTSWSAIQTVYSDA
jgi:hypothetical protein